MNTSPHPQQLYMLEELDAWALDDFSDLPLSRKALTDESFEAFRDRRGPSPRSSSICSSLCSTLSEE